MRVRLWIGSIVVLSALLVAGLAAYLLARPARDALGMAVTRSFAAGGSTLGGVVITTDDGWRTWSAPFATLHSQIFSIGLASAQDVFVAGVSATGRPLILASRDGGHRFLQQKVPDGNYTLYGLSFLDAHRGFAVGSGSAGGVVLSTQDAGRTWIREAEIPSLAAYAVAFTSPAEGWVAGRNTRTGRAVVLMSQDGGRTWRQSYAGGDYTLSALQFSGPSDGWAAGYGSGYSGVVVGTRDAGRTWRVVYGTNRRAIFSLSAVGTSQVWVTGMGTGSHGFVVHSADGGRTWQTQYDGGSHGLLAVSFRTLRDGYAIGSNATQNSVVLTTLDGGRTWKPHSVSVPGNAFFGIY